MNTLVEHPVYLVIQAVEETNFPGASRTGRRNQLYCHPAAQKYLPDRIGFALEFIIYDVDFWYNVVFTDEKCFQWGFQSTFNGHIRVYRPANTRFDEKYTSNNEKFGRFSVNIWAGVSGARGPGVLWHNEEGFNNEMYISIIR